MTGFLIIALVLGVIIIIPSIVLLIQFVTYSEDARRIYTLFMDKDAKCPFCNAISLRPPEQDVVMYSNGTFLETDWQCHECGNYIQVDITKKDMKTFKELTKD